MPSSIAWVIEKFARKGSTVTTLAALSRVQGIHVIFLRPQILLVLALPPLLPCLVEAGALSSPQCEDRPCLSALVWLTTGSLVLGLLSKSQIVLGFFNFFLFFQFQSQFQNKYKNSKTNKLAFFLSAYNTCFFLVLDVLFLYLEHRCSTIFLLLCLLVILSCRLLISFIFSTVEMTSFLF